jgi:hypothetical protein
MYLNKNAVKLLIFLIHTIQINQIKLYNKLLKIDRKQI